MYKLKQLPEDFVVEELTGEFGSKGSFLILWVVKRNRSTPWVVSKLSKFYRVKDKDVGYSGLKDKNAVTGQVFSVRTTSNSVPELSDCEVFVLGRAEDRINLGSHSSNSFRIVVRNLEKPLSTKYSYLNYYDEQRFQTNNVEIGSFLLNKKFKEAVSLIAKDNDRAELRAFLESNPSNFIDALKTVPRRILMLYVGAVQAFLFNSYLGSKVSATSCIERDFGFGPLFFPKDAIIMSDLEVVGFGTDDPEMVKFMAEWDLTPRSFVFPQLKSLSAEGTSRAALIKVEDLKISDLENDELNKGMKKQIVSFTLPKGSYATMVVKQLFL